MKKYKTVEGVDEQGNLTTFKIELPEERAILISDTPEWVAKILNGIKDLEIRKSKPNCNFPIDVYVYCTKGKSLIYTDGTDGKGDYVDYKYYESYKGDKNDIGSGKVVAKYTVRKIERIKKRGDAISWWFETDSLNNVELAARSRLGCPSMAEYLGRKTGYAWFIEDLIIFDEPKDISEFTEDKNFGTVFEKNVHRPPQSYMFVRKP